MRGQSIRGWALLLYLSAALLVLGCARTQAPPSQAMRALVRADISQVMTDIERDPTLGPSSNPWDYVGVSSAFPRLVGRGEPALEAIAAEIEQSKENGLREYLLAIAGNQILGRRLNTSPGTTRKDGSPSIERITRDAPTTLRHRSPGAQRG